ncbi:hypothetical protein DFH27DRAFT_553265 [Peziza echinospora]|nr:hypothetical protein DFH27DRAFT_553265 [Peziza echinospora]
MAEDPRYRFITSKEPSNFDMTEYEDLVSNLEEHWNISSREIYRNVMRLHRRGSIESLSISDADLTIAIRKATKNGLLLNPGVQEAILLNPELSDEKKMKNGHILFLIVRMSLGIKKQELEERANQKQDEEEEAKDDAKEKEKEDRKTFEYKMKKVLERLGQRPSSILSPAEMERREVYNGMTKACEVSCQPS